MKEFFTFMVDWSLRSAVTVGLGLACVLLLRRRSAAAQNAIWRITLSALALMPIAMAVSSKTVSVPVMEPLQAPVRTVMLAPTTSRFTYSTTFRSSAATSKAPEITVAPAVRIACLVYTAGLLAALAFWSIGYYKIVRIARQGSNAEGVAGGYRVLTTKAPELKVPITLGLLHPIIVLPSESQQWPEERVRAAIFHESAHIGRKDWAWQASSFLFCALQWFNPCVWLLNAALRSSSETAADDAVVTESGMGASTYAGELLNVAEAARGNFHSATAMARHGGVAGRLKRIVANGVERGRPRRRLVIGLAGLFATTGVLVASGSVAEKSGKDYEAKLSHGGVVEIVALGMNGRKDMLWSPNGAPLSESKRLILEPMLKEQDSSQPEKQGRLIDFYMRERDLPMKPGEDENGIFRVPLTARDWGYQGGWDIPAKDGRLQFDEWSAPKSAKKIDMDCAIAYGPYKEIAQGKLGDGQFGMRVEPSSNETDVSVMIPARYGQTQTMLEFYAGDQKQPSMGGPLEGRKDPATGDMRWDFAISPEIAKKADSYVLKSRSYEHVLIKGIHLPIAEPAP